MGELNKNENYSENIVQDDRINKGHPRRVSGNFEYSCQFWYKRVCKMTWMP